MMMISEPSTENQTNQ